MDITPGSLTVPLVNLDPELPAPRFAYNGDAAVDLSSTCDIQMAPFERVLVPCGISLALPQGYAGFVLPRSGLAIKHGISVVNGPGLIDSGYRGEIKVILINLDPHNAFQIKRGDRVAQLVVMKVENVNFLLCDELPASERGTGGFGSSGISC